MAHTRIANIIMGVHVPPRGTFTDKLAGAERVNYLSSACRCENYPQFLMLLFIGGLEHPVSITTVNRSGVGTVT